MAELGVAQETAGLLDPLAIHQDAARKNADGAVENAHMRVRDEMLDPRIPQKRIHEGKENRIVGTHQFAHGESLESGFQTFAHSRSDGKLRAFSATGVLVEEAPHRCCVTTFAFPFSPFVLSRELVAEPAAD